MMNNRYKVFSRFAAVIAAAFIMASCLEKMPGDLIPESEGMKTLSDAEQTLNGIYSAYMSGALYSGYLTLLPDIQTDFVYAVKGNSNTYGTHWLWDIRSTNSEIESVYGALYTVIGRCNFFLDQVEALRAGMTDDESIQTLDFYTGEVYCARALAYSELVKCFCEAYDPATAKDKLGVVLVDTYFGEKPNSRATLEKSYEFIISDLLEAERLLDEDNDYYSAVYFTKAAANAIHARVALYMQDWDSAIEYSGKLISNKAFELASVSVYTTQASPITGSSQPYTYVDYMWSNDLSFEIIWKVGFEVTSYGGSLGQVFLSFNNDYVYFYPDYVPAQWVLNLYSGTDARYNAYFTNCQTGYPHQLSWPLLTKYFGNMDFIKYMIYHVNMPKPLRLAEQYLIRAEAYCRKGAYSNANADLAALSKSRGASSAAVNAENWLDRISEERVKELYMEGFRLHDLKRWNRGFERTPQLHTQSEGSSLKKNAGDPLFVWPIPKNEIEAPGAEILPNESNR